MDKGVFRPIRNSELELGGEGEDLFLVFQKAIFERRRQEVIRIDFDESISSHLIKFINKKLNYKDVNTYKLPIPVNLSSIESIFLKDFKKLFFPKFKVRFPERIKDFKNDYFKAIANKDIVIHHPFESFEVVTQFIDQAADDPKVLSIKHTLYRTTDDSPIEASLVRAAQKGKLVTVIIELQARFDEERNLKWAKELELAGAQVVFGNIDMKTHAKITLVTRKQMNSVVNYAHYGTGNYHPRNARVYMDLSYFTCDKTLTNDAAKMFNYLTSYSEPTTIKKIVYSPITARNKLNELIRNEITNAGKNKPSGIVCKCNSTRIYCFYNGHKFPHRKNILFISSADLMQRNLDRRVETFIPIENETVHEQILNQILIASMTDNTNSWQMLSNGNYQKKEISSKEKKFSSHNFFIKNPSLSGRGSAKLKSRAKSNLKI